jgi:hypothetical protein
MTPEQPVAPPVDLAELRRLAEVVQEPWRSKSNRRWVKDQAAYKAATNPATILRLLDLLDRIARYSWGLHLAGTPNEQEAIGLIEDLRAALQAERPTE